MGFFSEKLRSFFRHTAEKPEGDSFFIFLEAFFDRDTAAGVVESFQRMGLPVPRRDDEFLWATEGTLVFLNRYGLVIRIETADLKDDKYIDRINDSAWILKPIVTIPAGGAVIELCPGCSVEQDKSKAEYLKEQLLAQRIDFSDDQTCNAGRLPVKTPRFPEGVPVVIDRLAVYRLTESLAPVRQALTQDALEAEEAQESLYGPLRESFGQAWPDTEKMREFWRLCERYVQERKLIAGWNEVQHDVIVDKTGAAFNVARAYETRLKSHERNISSAAAAARQSPLQPV